MGLEIYPEKYLSEEVLRSLTLAVNGNDDTTIKQAFLLHDGTTVIIEKLKDAVLGGMLKNPHDIKINCPSKIKISYCKTQDGTDDMAEEHVYITASSMEDLVEKWIKYKSDRKLDKTIEGEITGLSLTDEDENINLQLKVFVNEILNMLFDDDINIEFDSDTIYGSWDNYSEEEIERLRLVKNVIMTIVANILHNTDEEKVHCPVIKRDRSGFPIEVKSYIDESLFF